MIPGNLFNYYYGFYKKSTFFKLGFGLSLYTTNVIIVARSQLLAHRQKLAAYFSFHRVLTTPFHYSSFMKVFGV